MSKEMADRPLFHKVVNGFEATDSALSMSMTRLLLLSRAPFYLALSVSLLSFYLSSLLIL